MKLQQVSAHAGALRGLIVKGLRTALGMAMALCASVPAWADSVSGTVQDGYGRLTFTTDAKVGATTTGGVLAISFSSKTNLDPAIVAGSLPRILLGGRIDADGKTLRFTLNQPVKLHVSQIGTKA